LLIGKFRKTKKEKSEKMKVGDVVFRKDMPQFRFRIVEENKTFPECWTVEPFVKYRGFGRWDRTKMIAKDDERWEVENPQ